LQTKEIYLWAGLKQTSRQWYIKFHKVIASYDFIKNFVVQCIYLKVNRSKVTFIVLYVNNILLASNNLGLLHKTKQFLSQNFEKKDLDETSYVIGIESHIDRKQIILKLSQKAYTEKVLERFRLKNCSTSIVPIIKEDKFNNDQCPRNALEQEQMKNILYAFAVVSLLYAQQSALDLTLQWQLECWVDIKTTQDWNIEKMQRKSSVICKELRTTV